MVEGFFVFFFVKEKRDLHCALRVSQPPLPPHFPPCHPNHQDPFGEKRGRFDYQGLLARLSATHRRIREKSLAEDEHNEDDSDLDTSSSGTDPDSQGSSQP